MNREKRPRFFSGTLRSLVRVGFAARCISYLLRRRAYPLFYIRKSRNGVLRTLELEKELGLTKIIYVNGSFFSTTSLPHYPSKAFDFAVAHGALNLAAAGTEAKQYIDNVILGITRRCGYDCKHCYERNNIADEDTVPIERWREIIETLQNVGVGTIILSGGEPMMRYQGLLQLLTSADKERSDFHLHTSGFGVTDERARELHDAGLFAAAIGLEDADPVRYAKMRGNGGAFDQAIRAISCFRKAGVLVYLNLGLTKELVRSGELWRYFDLAEELGVSFIQLLEPRPCGGYQGRAMEDLFSEDDRKEVEEFVHRGNNSKRFRNHPLLFYVADIESPSHMGCGMGGLSHFTIDGAGNMRPCVFVPVSFGNIMEEDFRTIFSRMRSAVPRPIRTMCPSIALSQTTRELFGASDRPPYQFSALHDKWERALYGNEESRPKIRV